MTTPRELQGLSQEELRFWRLIEERAPDDGAELVTLACGHSVVMIVPLPEWQRYHMCIQCVNDWAEAERKLLRKESE